MLSNHNHQKKIAVINDMSGFGRCSLAVAIPVISVMKIQCCPVPTSIFSNHTGFKSFFFEDYTDRMQPYIDEWKKLGLSFSGISTGFLGSKEQIQIVLRFLKDFGTEENVIVIDPVMGENISYLYSGNVHGDEEAGKSCGYHYTESDRSLHFDGYALS